MNMLLKFRKKNSGEIARKRLQMILLSDKVNCSPEILDMIKHDIIHAISSYMEIDSCGVELQLKRIQAPENRRVISVLYAGIPISDTHNKGIYHNAF